MPESFPWYEAVAGTEKLEQGDVVWGCPIVIPLLAPSPGAKLEADVHDYDVVVMSQSCDLQYGKLDLVLVCPFWPLADFADSNSLYRKAENKEGLRRGYYPGYHLLNKCELSRFETDLLVVDFRNVLGVPFDFLTGFAKRQPSRIRLLPPYREHLSQAFARFFMRVGLPVDIPSFT